MARKEFTSTKIPEYVSTDMTMKNFILGAIHVDKVLKSFAVGISKLLGDSKSVDTPIAVALRKNDGTFIAGAKVEYHKNPDDPDNAASGNWSYIWTFDEKDLDGARIINLGSDPTHYSYFIAVADKLFHMRFQDDATAYLSFSLIMDYISHWLEDNATEGEEQTLVCNGAFEASCAVEDGVIVKSIVPDGEIKVLIKGDDSIQAMDE